MEGSHEVSLLANCATNDNFVAKRENRRRVFLVLCWGSELGGADCLEMPLMFMDLGLSALVPLYLSETKQPPDEGYIRHALSYFPTITPWSWTPTISFSWLPLGYLDPAYVPQYCYGPRGVTRIKSLPTSSNIHST